MSNIIKGYELAKEMYAQIGVDVDAAIATLDKTPLSIHCWQGDDVKGFENPDGALTGGIQTTGNYPGRARNSAELFQDIEKVLSYIPGQNKINVHALYLDNQGKNIDRDQIDVENFTMWADWAVANKVGLDFNPSFFSHAKSADGFTLSNADKSIRDFWIEHGKRSRKIAEYFGKRTGQTCLTNFWMPDGDKEVLMDTISPRIRMKEALDEIFKEPIDPKYNKDAVECKLFGIGSEAYVTGSHEFYMGYALSRNKMLTLDVGHFHPTEKVSDKLSALLVYLDEILLHVSRPVRWDSDHVVTFDDELQAVMNQIVRLKALDKIHISLDYFDASINRIMAWVIGSRNAKKALLAALLQPVDKMLTLDSMENRSERLALTEELKTMPFGAVWEYYCEKSGVMNNFAWIADVKKYESDVLAKR